MKVLLISYHFPPDPAVGSIRTGRIAAALASAGHDVHVIAPLLEGRPPETGQALSVARIKRRRNAREIALALRDRFRRRRNPPLARTRSGEGGWVTADDVAQWKRFLVAMALMPDDQQGFILPAFIRGVRLHLRHRFDLLYTSGPPHSAHVTGLLLKTVTRIRWAAEFRDPWTDNAMQPRYARSDTARRAKLWLERRTLSSADHIVAVSEAAGRLFAAKVPQRAERVVVIRNGIVSSPRTPAPPAASDTTRITYLGNLYHRRDPRPFLRALGSLRRSGRLRTRAVEVDFFGNCRWYHAESMEEEVRSLGLSDWVRFHDLIPQAETPGVMARSDLLLLLAQDQPLQIPQKLYDYLGAGRPILAFGERDGETALMLAAAGGHYLVPDDTQDAVEEVLLRALEGQPDSLQRFDPTVEWSAERELNRLIATLDGGEAHRTRAQHMLHDRDIGDRRNVPQTTAGP